MPYLHYQRTHCRMTSGRKCRHLNSDILLAHQKKPVSLHGSGIFCNGAVFSSLFTFRRLEVTFCPLKLPGLFEPIILTLYKKRLLLNINLFASASPKTKQIYSQSSSLILSNAFLNLSICGPERSLSNDAI